MRSAMSNATEPKGRQRVHCPACGWTFDVPEGTRFRHGLRCMNAAITCDAQLIYGYCSVPAAEAQREPHVGQRCPSDEEVDALCAEMLREAADEGRSYFCPWINSSEYQAHNDRHRRDFMREMREAVAKIGTIPDGMNGHEESEECWCSPRIERYEEGNLIIHNEEN